MRLPCGGAEARGNSSGDVSGGGATGVLRRAGAVRVAPRSGALRPAAWGGLCPTASAGALLAAGASLRRPAAACTWIWVCPRGGVRGRRAAARGQRVCNTAWAALWLGSRRVPPAPASSLHVCARERRAGGSARALFLCGAVLLLLSFVRRVLPRPFALLLLFWRLLRLLLLAPQWLLPSRGGGEWRRSSARVTARTPACPTHAPCARWQLAVRVCLYACELHGEGDSEAGAERGVRVACPGATLRTGAPAQRGAGGGGRPLPPPPW